MYVAAVNQKVQGKRLLRVVSFLVWNTSDVFHWVAVLSPYLWNNEYKNIPALCQSTIAGYAQ